MLTLLALPLARRTAPAVGQIDQSLTETTARLPQADTTQAQQDLLNEMLGLIADIERIAAATNYRFSAARAYHELVERRIEELREVHTPTLQPLQFQRWVESIRKGFLLKWFSRHHLDRIRLRTLPASIRGRFHPQPSIPQRFCAVV